MKTPRGTARALRRAALQEQRAQAWADRVDAAQRLREDEDRAYYLDLRAEGYSHEQAMLMSGRGDPDSLGLSQ